MPKISVIVPIYNTELFLNRCLNSLENQTESDIEFLLIDDGSTDKCIDIMESYSYKDSRFRIYSFPKNRGVSIARNTGIEVATGKYIGFVDSDDYVDENYFESLSTILDITQAPIACSTADYTHLSKNIIDFTDSNVDLTVGGASSCVRLFHRDLIGNDRFLENCRLEDTAFTFLMHMKGKKMVIASNTQYYYCTDNMDSFNYTEYSSPQTVLDTLKIMHFLNDKVKEEPEFSCFYEKIQKIQMRLLLASASMIEDFTTSSNQCCKLMNHLYSLIEKKYDVIQNRTFNSKFMDTFSSNCIDTLLEYRNRCYQSVFYNMEDEKCEELFKAKMKVLAKNEIYRK